MTEFVVRHYHEVSLDTLGKVMFGNSPGEEGARFEFTLRLIVVEGVKPHLQEIEIEKIDVTRWAAGGEALTTRIPELFVMQKVKDQLNLEVRQDFATGVIDMEGIMYERQTDDF